MTQPSTLYFLIKKHQPIIDKGKRAVKALRRKEDGAGMMDAAILESYIEAAEKANEDSNFIFYINKIKENTLTKKASTKIKSEFTQQWILDNSISICREYEKGMLTLRALHYQLVSKGMTNDLGHYKKVVNTIYKRAGITIYLSTRLAT